VLGHLADKTLAFFVENFPSLEAIAVGGPIGFAWSWACLYCAGYLKVRRGLKTGYTRKIFHFLIFTSVAAIHWIWGTSMVCLFGGICTLVIFYAILRGDGHLLFEAMARESDRPHRTHYIVVPYCATLLGGLISNILFGPVALVGYLVTGLGDAIGKPVGARFGRHRYRVPSLSAVRASRSWEGSGAVFLMSVVSLFVGKTAPGMEFAPSFFLLLPVIGFACACVEAASPHGWDNATMQVVPTMLVKGLM